ncbi:GNAT family N-acetyltransferase [Halobaculum halobium]|uniref:GNAT family N-acetyltransferase n=1 Tax=Halobaculum halobium TaxID=3032281 RepID=A0ABD5TGU3_9EURY|nr:GNAT family N-acetyltransferase [Halobaculum sp. SYNS20]
MRTSNTRNKTTDKIATATTEEEIDEVQGLFNSNRISNELHSFTHRDNLERAVDQTERQLFYISEGDIVVSAVMVWCESRILDEGEAQIRLLATHPDFRRQGLATRLVVESIKFASQHGKRSMKVEAAANDSASAYWRSIGFAPDSSRTTDNGRKMLMMKRPIPETLQED